MYAKLSSRGDCAAEPEEDVQEIESDRENRVDREAFIKGRREEVDQGENGEDHDKHVIIDDRRVAAGGGGDHVADEGHYYDRTKQLGELAKEESERRYSSTSQALRPMLMILDTMLADVAGGGKIGIHCRAIKAGGINAEYDR